MPLNNDTHEKIEQRFDELIQKIDTVLPSYRAYDARNHPGSYLTPPATINVDGRNVGFFRYKDEIKQLTKGLIRYILNGTKRIDEYVTIIEQSTYDSADAFENCLSALYALRDEYRNGFLDNIHNAIIADISADYMSQAESLMDESGSGQFNHVPGAVLAGAVLEDALRRLCKRQNPPVDVLKVNGNPKTMGALIDDLKKSGAYNELKAKQLRAWADIRNSAAHGRFEEFGMDDVEQMIAGINTFLADYL